MLRIDGYFTIYVLKGRNTEKKSEKWFSPSYDSFGTPPGFCASDECWQKTGVHGTFDEAQAFAALQLFAKAYPENDWRMEEVKISQHRSQIASMSAKKPGESFNKPYPATAEYRRRIDIVQGLNA
jgi:hypothetical protein